MRRYRRLIAILALATLATLTAVAMGAAADEHFSDWTVLGDDIRMGETIVVDGTLTIQLNGNLSLDGCIVRFTNPVQGVDRVLVRGGKLTLSDTTIISEVPGRIQVSDDLGRFEVFGRSTIANLDILVKSRGTLTVRNADLVLEGMYTSFSQNDPLTVEVNGKLTVQDSSVSLQYAFLTTTGIAAIVGSKIEGSRDYGWEYDGYLERLRFMDGSVAISDSTLLELWHGVLAQGTIEATGCEFKSSDLRLFAPWWHQSLEARVEDCAFIASELTVELEEGRADNVALDIDVLDTTIIGGSLHLDLNTTYKGELLVSGVNITDHQDYGVTVLGTGFDGSLVLDGLWVDGQRGIQVSGDFSGMVIANSTVRAHTTAMDVSGLTGSIPASIINLTLVGKVGLRVRNAHLEVVDCHLYGSTQPVIGEGGSSLNLVDCLLEEEDATLSVAPRDKTATMKVSRHLEVAEVAWQDGPIIEDGEVLLYSLHLDLLQPVWSSWRIDDGEPPLLRLLEWTLDGEGVEDRFVFHQVRPEMEISDHTFHIVGTTLDPWQQGPFDLIFLDDARPFIVLDGDVMLNISEPKIKLHGSVGDIGTGLAHVRYVLRTVTGEEVRGNPVDHLAGDQWRTTIDVTGNMQMVELIATDRAGNVQVVPTRNIQVNVPTPVLTILTPGNGLLTNEPSVQIVGTAGWYASLVEVQVESADGTKKRPVVIVPVVRNAFEVYIELLVEDLNTITLTCFDPFDGNYEVTLTVDLDTIPPLMSFTGLFPEDDNYVNSPSMIIQGRTNDPDAQVSILGQVVGLVGDGAFAATVQLAEGRQTIRVVAVDPAGNKEIDDLEIILDTKAPGLTLLSPSRTPYYTNADEVLVEVAPSEALGSVTIDGEAVDPGSDKLVRTIRPRHGVPTDLVIVARDLAGNEATLSVIIFLDTEPPQLILLSPNNGLITNTTSVQVIALSNEDGCTLEVDGMTLETIESRRNRLVGTHQLTGADGARLLTITLTDRAGNTAVEEVFIDLDTVPPRIGILGLSDGARVTTEPLEVNGYTDADVRVVWVNEVMVDLDANGEFSATLHLKEGWQFIKVLAVDKAGNIANRSVHVKVLEAPDFGLPFEALVGGTILLVFAGLVSATEAGRWSLMMLFLPLYTKLRKDKILDQRTRGLIEGYITANPGCNYTIIRDNLALADGTLTYHLQVLEREGFVYSIREGLFRCFYPQGMPPPKRGKLHLSDTQMDVIRISKRIPGITVGEIASAMNRRPNVISYHLKLLREGGLVRMEEDGRHVRVYPVEAAVALI